MSVNMSVQVAEDLRADIRRALPSQAMFQRWLDKVMARCPNDFQTPAELSIRIVGEAEIAQLNQRFRKQTGATNVLSFPFESPSDVRFPLLGDVVICAPILVEEAKVQAKTVEAHWAHILIHGTLHLLGYDHLKDQDAVKMESIEIKLLAQLGYSNPYGDSSG